MLIPPEAAQQFKELQQALVRYTEQGTVDVDIGDLIRRFRHTLKLSPTHFARRLHVTPQTVHRWERNAVKPRLRQLSKFKLLLTTRREIDSPPKNESSRGVAQTTRHVATVEAVTRLGIRFLDSLMPLQTDAKEVWIVYGGRLRESDRGYIGESVRQALQQGVRFNYVFFRGTPAAISFRDEFKPWIEGEGAQSQLTGYSIESYRLAYQLGLIDAPFSWIVIEYGPGRAAHLKRRFDVFVELKAREYLDGAHTHIKNEDGQACWIELAAPWAQEWWNRLDVLRKRNISDEAVKLIRLKATVKNAR